MNSTEAGVGHIEYYFKGMQMKPEPAKVKERLSDKSLKVMRTEDGQTFEFVSISGNWLLKAGVDQNSLLYGTRFTLSL